MIYYFIQLAQDHKVWKAVPALFFIILCIIPSGCIRKGRLYRRNSIISGTFIEVTSPYKNAAQVVFSTMKELDKVFNVYDKESQLSLINAKAGNAPVKASGDLIELLKLAKQLYKLTDGAFDPSIGKIVFYWKEKMGNKRLKDFPGDDELNSIMEFKGMDLVEINEDKNTVFIKKKGLILDLGGIAKGYMIDRAVQALKKNNIDSALINAGGDMFCLGRRNHKPWNIGIRNPKTLSGILNTLHIADEAIATSGDYEQFFEYDGKAYSHIINPVTGLPVQSSVRSVTVIAHNATTADGLSTAFFVMGKEKIQEFLKDNRSNLKVILVEEKEGKLSIHCLGPVF